MTTPPDGEVIKQDSQAADPCNLKKDFLPSQDQSLEHPGMKQLDTNALSQEFQNMTQTMTQPSEPPVQAHSFDIRSTAQGSGRLEPQAVVLPTRSTASMDPMYHSPYPQYAMPPGAIAPHHQAVVHALAAMPHGLPYGLPLGNLPLAMPLAAPPREHRSPPTKDHKKKHQSLMKPEHENSKAQRRCAAQLHGWPC